MESITKEAYFTYCKTCIHEEKPETDSPCDECLQVFSREDSHKPKYYEEKETAK